MASSRKSISYREARSSVQFLTNSGKDGRWETGIKFFFLGIWEDNTLGEEYGLKDTHFFVQFIAVIRLLLDNKKLLFKFFLPNWYIFTPIFLILSANVYSKIVVQQLFYFGLIFTKITEWRGKS